MQWIAGLAFQPRPRIALLREFLQLLKVKAPPALRTDPLTGKQSIIGPAPKRNLLLTPKNEAASSSVSSFVDFIVIINFHECLAP